MEISKRLLTIANHVPENKVLADIGTDHGLLPVYLVREGKTAKAFAADVSKGSLVKAEALIAGCHLEHQIKAVRSDGFKALLHEPIQVAVLAGMGGGLMVALLEAGMPATLTDLVCSPHSEPDKVRMALHKLGFRILTEQMVLEEQQYYTIIRATKSGSEKYSRLEYKYGKMLMENNDPVFRENLVYKLAKYDKLLDHLKVQVGECVLARENELNSEMDEIKEVIQWIENYQKS